MLVRTGEDASSQRASIRVVRKLHAPADIESYDYCMLLEAEPLLEKSLVLKGRTRGRLTGRYFNRPKERAIEVRRCFNPRDNHLYLVLSNNMRSPAEKRIAIHDICRQGYLLETADDDQFLHRFDEALGPT